MTDEELRQQFKVLSTLVENVKDSLEREIMQVKERLDRMETRFDKIAAGAHYVTRIVEWSEKQDHFQIDILRRVQALEEKVYRSQK
jgi:hypothetical protein